MKAYYAVGMVPSAFISIVSFIHYTQGVGTTVITMLEMNADLGIVPKVIHLVNRRARTVAASEFP